MIGEQAQSHENSVSCEATDETVETKIVEIRIERSMSEHWS